MTSATATTAGGHTWQFFRAGGVDQVLIRTGADLVNLRHLDQKLWVALACPTRGVELDAATLAALDADGDGRFRANELLDAIAWAAAHVRDVELLASGRAELNLADLRDDDAAGRGMLEQARRILAEAGSADGALITLEHVAAHEAKLQALALNGDGVLNPEKIAQALTEYQKEFGENAAENQPDNPTHAVFRDILENAEQNAVELADLIRFIVQSHGAVEGVDGQAGLNQATLDAFFADVQKLADWYDAAPDLQAEIAPKPEEEKAHFGPRLSRAQMHAAAAAVAAVEAKVVDFFTRAQLAAFDEAAAAALVPTKDGYAAIAAAQLAGNHEAIAALPLAGVGASLPLEGTGLNPAWVASMQTLRDAAVTPLLGETDGQLTQAQWTRLLDALAATRAWLAAQPAPALAALSREQAGALLSGPMHARLSALIAQDAAAQAHAQHTGALRKLLLLCRDLVTVANNFVSFADFYRRKPAVFQAGTLYLDARSCDLTVDVTDAPAHAALAGMAKTYLAYCECRRKNEKGEMQKKNIVAAFTAGDVDFLFVGRNGIFYDRQNQDWDATITKIIENPTSIGQAFFSPYKKFVRLVEEQIAKRAAAKEGEVNAGLDARATQLVATPGVAATNAAKNAAEGADGKKVDVGTVAALGVALGSISTVIVAVLGKFVEMGPWIPVGILGLVLAISGPSMLIAWLKLRERTLGPILDASGWAINGRMKINLPLGRSLSQLAKTPANARRSLNDPWAAPSPLRWLWPLLMLLVIVGAAWWLKWLDPHLPENWRREKPAPVVEMPAPAVALPVANDAAAEPAVENPATDAPAAEAVAGN